MLRDHLSGEAGGLSRGDVFCVTLPIRFRLSRLPDLEGRMSQLLAPGSPREKDSAGVVNDVATRLFESVRGESSFATHQENAVAPNALLRNQAFEQIGMVGA